MSILPPSARRAAKVALRLQQAPARTAAGAIKGRLIPHTAATTALAFGASALRFAIKPNPLTAADVVRASVRAAEELGRDGETDRGR